MKRKLLGCSAALLVSTCALAQVPNADTQEGKEMQIQVHSYMSEHPSVSIDDAITRLAVQGEVMSDIEALRIEFADRLTELSIKDAPDQHILVQLKGPDPVAGRTITTESGTTRVVFEVGHKYTQDEFYALLAQHRPLLHSAIPGITGTTGFPGEDRVLIDIKGDSGQAEELKDTIKKLERVTGLKIEVRPNMPKSVNAEYVVGGAPLQSNNSYCTSGFPVIHKATGRRGITTAAHCPDNLIYGNYATGAGKYTVPLTFVDQINDASHDVQWHTVGSHTPLREVYATSTSDYSRRRIMYMWTNATQGQSMCFRGVTSQYTCGTVVSIKHNPELACGPTGNLPCANAWIRIEGSSLACGYGDSGAAIFFGDNGYGIVAKASLQGGSCKGVSAMPWGAVSALGLEAGG
ncbi:S1 family peptidase [Stenotrophomonas maltophilia]|uniref:S1 family peptidase n=1 Tax=Stenotrophomonas maltophilia TaxID=40324 RepID=UPI001312B8B3|nr:S1 family peptidase [Stenotrophomonas maltophilia]MBN4996393.1 hypothetical protein [Stenotrophomonas maltophilia]MCO7498691.1 S1 family peptidase [Stenotrophomonas maltophilia]